MTKRRSERRDLIHRMLSTYGIFNEVPFTCVDPQPVSSRTFKSSNYLAALRAFEEKMHDENPNTGGLGGELPRYFVVIATQELIRSHVDTVRRESVSAWLPFHQVMSDIEKLSQNDYKRADVGSLAEFLWTSGKTVKGKELCSILNAAIREDDPTVIMHAVVLSVAINKRRVSNRDAKKGLFSGISPREYPQKLLNCDMGHGRSDTGSRWHGSWRGGGFRDKFQGFFKPGVKYRVPGVLATALKKDVAMTFIAKSSKIHPRILWCIRVDGRGIQDPEHRVMHASFVSQSQYRDETEFLYSAYSAFVVEEVIWATRDASGRYKITEYHQVLIRAAKDNKEWSEDLPLAPWF